MADKGTNQTRELRARVFNCLQYETNPKTGADLHFNEQNIIDCMEHKSITRYAYIKHDKDTVSEWDIETGRGSYSEADLGQPKGVHWHIVIECAQTALPVSTIAKWLGIPESMIDIPKGRGAFIDCVEYLGHSDIKQELKGKYIYDKAEVKSNFDWETEVTEMVLRKTKYEKALSQADFLKNEVLYSGMRIFDVMDRYPTIYQKEQTVFDRLRMRYLVTRAELPPRRINFYIEGKTGYGKDTMAYSIARALYPNLVGKYDDAIYFEIGGNKVTFDGYDGQPVIIWSEFRADTFVNALGGYEEVLSSIDVIPKSNLHHKKFGSVKLINAVNIVTSTQPYSEFLKGLIPDNDPDPTQANRRFPIIIPIRMSDFDILINSGYLDADTYHDYTAWQSVAGSFGSIARKLNSRPDTLQQVKSDMTTPIVQAHNIVNDSLSHDEYEGMTDDEVLSLFEDYGQVKTYRDKTEAELKADYQNYLHTCYEDDLSKCKDHCENFDEWSKSYWVEYVNSYEIWLKVDAVLRTTDA